MSRRGDDLHRHILWAAKDVFLELGFERASMDEVAARASTSKRTLYAHFGSKENLYLAVIELVRERYLERIGDPGAYAGDSREAVVRFLATIKQMILWEQVVRTCRMAISEAERLPDASRDYYELMFGSAERRLADFLAAEFAFTPERAGAVARSLFARTLYGALLAALFAAGPSLGEPPEDDAPPSTVDTASIEAAVDELLGRPVR
jgi:AcrR family transcriptional regulator